MCFLGVDYERNWRFLISSPSHFRTLFPFDFTFLSLSFVCVCGLLLIFRCIVVLTYTGESTFPVLAHNFHYNQLDLAITRCFGIDCSSSFYAVYACIYLCVCVRLCVSVCVREDTVVNKRLNLNG